MKKYNINLYNDNTFQNYEVTVNANNEKSAVNKAKKMALNEFPYTEWSGVDIEEVNPKIIAVYEICNTIALCITGIEYGIDDKITSVFAVGDDYKSKRTTKVYTDISGNAYIIRYKTKYYLNEFIKTDF